MKFRSSNADATVAFGEQLAAVLRPGDVVVLSGDLGAGKTTLTRGIARGLGVTDRVTSPTFALVHHYDSGPVRMVHVDAWRLDDSGELEDVGLEDVLAADALTVVEWGERVSTALPADRLEIRLGLGRTDDERTVDVSTIGAAWQARRDALAAAGRALDPDG